jgi:hypothetical protein
LFATEAVAFAQGVIKVHPDSALACGWNSGETSLAAAQAIKVSVSYDGGAAAPVAQACTAGTPIQCSIPVTVQTVGVHTIAVTGVNQVVDPVDGTVLSSNPVALTSGSYEIVPPAVPPSPPAPGSGFRIGKLVGGIIGVVIGLLAFIHFGH